ncbi:hypothetical protein ARMGADRAFT_1064397 [Armillaria gallica]|uniref:C2H2-type domain-containing protein n=1 Tax=Armillaria gallica TaxID=47427 RepID=A0A2H3DTG2_ARMGA|nr:hypothetical protein ARMGADRAFT_1064397 [Armillaria gallica]
MRCTFKKVAIRRPDLFVCSFEECNKAFVGRDGLNRHLKTHYDEHRYQCPQCDTRTHQASNMKRHIDGQRLGPKPNACPDCVESFADKGFLVRHRKKEHGYKHQHRRTPKDIIKEIKETQPGSLRIQRLSTPRASWSAKVANTVVSPSPSPSPSTPSSTVDNSSGQLDCNTDTPILPQTREVYPTHTAGFPLEGQFPKTMDPTSSLLSLPDRSKSLPPTMEESSLSNGQGPGTSAVNLANYSAAADLDMTDNCDDLLEGSVPSPDPDASFEEVMPVPFDFAFAFE